jgi:2-methylcitrate dehydratase PrpD
VSTPAVALAEWATTLEPTDAELGLADRALLDTIAVAHAARDHPLRHVFDRLGPAGRLAARAHVLDFDDLHLPSTAHISAVCVPATLATGGDARAYLAGAGVMARLGTALGWGHYAAGWHATCTAGAPAAAVAAAVGRGLDGERTAVALALAVPAAGGVQRAFGAAAKALQVGFAADAGVRAAELAEAGAGADPRALEDWMRLVGGNPDHLQLGGDAVPGGVAVKLYPCCYALQRPIAAVSGLAPIEAERVRLVVVRTPGSSLTPLIHHAPRTGLEAKFSLEYGLAAAILDGRPGIESFSDDAVARDAARRLMRRVEVVGDERGEGLLAGEVEVEIALAGGRSLEARLDIPPGAPGRPLRQAELDLKLEMCGEAGLESLTWRSASAQLVE